MTSARLSVALAAALVLGSQPVAAQSEAAGRRVAERYCADCHLIARTGARPGLKAPGFLTISRRAVASEAWIVSFLSRPHATMPTVYLDANDALNIASYIVKLKDR